MYATGRAVADPKRQTTHYRINQHETNIEIEMSVSFSRYHIYCNLNDIFLFILFVAMQLQLPEDSIGKLHRFSF